MEQIIAIVTVATHPHSLPADAHVRNGAQGRWMAPLDVMSALSEPTRRNYKDVVLKESGSLASHWLEGVGA